MKYFITGATGFLGGRIAKILLEKGDTVIVLARNPAKAGELRKLGATVIKGDITDKDSMRHAMNGANGVFHVAAWYKIGVKNKSIAKMINVDGTRNVLELMQELKIPKGVYTSTLAVNSDTGGKEVDENYEFKGKHISEYDRTKAEAHKIAKQFISRGLPLVILMPGLIYGPGGTSLSDESLRLYLKKKLPAIPSKSAYNWAHVDDVAQIHVTAMEKAKPGTVYIVGGPSHTLSEAFSISNEITGIRKPVTIPYQLLKFSSYFVQVLEKFITLPPLYSSETMRVQAGVTYLGNNNKAKKELNYTPRNLKEGLKETFNFELTKFNIK